MRRVVKILRFLLSISAVSAGVLFLQNDNPGEWPQSLEAGFNWFRNAAADNPIISILLLIAVVASGAHAFIRRSKPVEPMGVFFEHKKLLNPPLIRPGYSDRMAYLLAEFSDLAYHVIEPNEAMVVQLVEASSRYDLTVDSELKQFLQQCHDEIKPDQLVHLEQLKEVLTDAGFAYVDHFNKGSTQGFVSVRAGPQPLIIVAFRGSEKEVEDWLTNAQAVPTEFDADDPQYVKRVHTGFLDGFNAVRKDLVGAIGKARDSLGEHGRDAPIYFTGHSLGGALAQIATRELEPDSYGACYTFGAPRVANYNFFLNVKTPHYRVVNSSDIVPRVPPGAEMVIADAFLQFVEFLVSRFRIATDAVELVRGFVDKMKHYRHFGDQRYLSDVESGGWSNAHVISNPPLIDRSLWLWRHLSYSLSAPVKSHSMVIYRKKLSAIAEKRMAPSSKPGTGELT